MHARPAPSRQRPLVAGLCVLVALLAAGGVVVVRSRSGSEPGAAGPPVTRATTGTAAATGAAPSTSTAAVPTTTAPTTAATTAAATCLPWGCPMQRRLAAATALVRTEPGQLGIAVLDRRTGAVWRAGTAGHAMWASSTPKLAIATDLLERSRTGAVTLDATARRQLAAMLSVSDDAAADALWDRFGGPAMLPRFRDTYGMAGVRFVPGFPARWGFLTLSTADLQQLMTYVLTRLDPADRTYLVGAMRTTGAIQHWGVWAAGAGAGAKDGWSIEYDAGRQHWCTSSVGFAGPGERYVVAVMDDLLPGAGIAAGVHAVSDVVATVFGAPVPAPVTVPAESTGR